MKTDKVAALCKKTKTIEILRDSEGEQFLSDGLNFFFCESLPKMTAGDVLAVLNIPEKERGKYNISGESYVPDETVSFLETLETDKSVSLETFTVGDGSGAYFPVYTSLGVRLIPTSYLKPFDDQEFTYFLFERLSKSGNTPYIVVKNGLFLLGILRPLTVPEALADAIHRMHACLMVEDTEPGPLTDPETGEIIGHLSVTDDE